MASVANQQGILYWVLLFFCCLNEEKDLGPVQNYKLQRTDKQQCTKWLENTVALQWLVIFYTLWIGWTNFVWFVPIWESTWETYTNHYCLF